MEKPKRKKTGGGPKRAPEGYYTHKQARERLGMTPSTFSYYVRKGKITRIVPPLRKEGYYSKRQVDELANELALFLHTTTIEKPEVETRPALPADAEGVVHVLAVFGWQTTTPEQRREWYEVNPFLDYVVTFRDEVAGYIHAAPFTSSALEDIMSGKRRSWHMTPQDYLRYEAGKDYSLYIGIAVRPDIEKHTQRLAFRLISGFIAFLEELAEQRITIRRLYAVSAEPDGQKLCADLGFVQMPAREGDLFPRFELDLDRSESLFARLYQKALERKSSR